MAVPNSVNDYRDILNVIRQIRPLESVCREAAQFGLEKAIEPETRMLAFAYFLGVMLGDMSKMRSTNKTGDTMSVMLKLSQSHQSNLRFGDFVSVCLGLIGIRVNRIEDHSEVLSSRYRYNAFRWLSQSSPFLLWIFEQCLGLRQGETTTRDPIRARWLTATPREFRIWFVQGLADSDGYVDLNKHEVGLIVEQINRFLQTCSTHWTYITGPVG